MCFSATAFRTVDFTKDLKYRHEAFEEK